MNTPIHRLIRSKRRSLALQVTQEGHLVVRAPRFLSDSKILKFVEEKKSWIEHVRQRIAERLKTAPKQFTGPETAELKYQARKILTERVNYFAGLMKVKFAQIRLTSATSRYGSCGPQGNLSFQWRLVLAPKEILDYVVVHELAHLIERNHSSRFWAKVEEFYPEYKTARVWLRKNRF
jgi:predicted metal-dependent hydrolase